MGRPDDRRIEFREIGRSDGVSLYDLHCAFWRGEFENRGRTSVQCLPYALEKPEEASRDYVSRIIGWGSSWLPPEFRRMTKNRQRWPAIARVSRADFDDFENDWLRFFGRFTIPQRELKAWLQSRTAEGNDSKRQKIEGVLDAGTRIRARRPDLPINSIANRLVEQGKSQGFKVETVRKILAGRYEPQKAREIPGLMGWRR